MRANRQTDRQTDNTTSTFAFTLGALCIMKKLRADWSVTEPE